MTKKFLDALRGPVQQDDAREGHQHNNLVCNQSGDTTNALVVQNYPPIIEEKQLTTGECQYGTNASLGAGVPQSRGVSGLVAGVPNRQVVLWGLGAPSALLMMQTSA